MNIKIVAEKRKGDKYFRADCTDLPGSPPCGFGYTKAEAIAHLFLRLSTDGKSNWIQYVDSGSLFINKKQWKWPEGFLYS